jgi:DNA processing protein
MLCLNDADYPKRLKEAPDAPLMLFYKGNADLNARHIIDIVGTRHCTRYGEDVIRTFVRDLHKLVPDTLIVSGLAYGVDIHAHREALANGMETVAVLAHGLDTLYPPAHRDTANEMISHGGLITEYMTRTQPDKLNFVRRNRITAGLCDATILVESARRGGGLITTRIAKEYNRDVFAFPGPVGAPYSEGCNNLIRSCGAGLITSATDFVEDMGWQNEASLEQARVNGIERQLFPNLSADEQRIFNVLQATNDLRQDVIAVKTGLPAGSLTALLFQLEMKGVVKAYAGGTYHLMK